MRRIGITVACVADHYADKERERIIEFMDPVTQKGGLICFRRQADGRLLIQPYRLDAGVEITLPGEERS